MLPGGLQGARRPAGMKEGGHLGQVEKPENPPRCGGLRQAGRCNAAHTLRRARADAGGAQFRVQVCTPCQLRQAEPQAGRLRHHEGEEAGGTGLWPVIGAGAILPLPATRTIRRGGRSEERCLDRLGMTRDGTGGALGGRLAWRRLITLTGASGAGRAGLAQLHDIAVYALMAAFRAAGGAFQDDQPLLRTLDHLEQVGEAGLQSNRAACPDAARRVECCHRQGNSLGRWVGACTWPPGTRRVESS